jgi:sensor histidine kinase YesM
MREGVGLRSTRARLEAMFPGAHSLTLDSAPDAGTCVTITFPDVRAKVAASSATATSAQVAPHGV